MLTTLLCAALLGAPPAPIPVLVELFTSEGWSSCPPADGTLARLAGAASIEGVDVLALEEHVDYWDYLGWRDPWSSREMSLRQAGYVAALGRRQYTPQMVVDGATDVLGSDESAVRAAIAAAARAPKGRVALRLEQGKLRIAVEGLPARGEAAEVFLGVSESGLHSKVERGENAGRTLAHGPVLRALARVGSIAAGAAGASFEAELPLPLGPRRRAVVFVQGEKSRRVLAAGAL